MQIKEFATPITAKSLNESLGKRFGKKINLEQFTLEQLQDVRNRIRTKLSQVEMSESFSNVIESDEYQKSRMMLDVLNAELSERGDIEEVEEAVEVTEGAEDEAELVMAAKDMVDRVTGWMEDTAEMQSESMLELADAIRDEMGTEAAETFTQTVKPALDELYGSLESTRAALTSGVGQLTGEAEPTDMMGDDDMDMEPEMEPTADMDDMPDLDGDAEGSDDQFGADAAAAGGEEDAGREKRESIERITKKVKKESVNPRKIAQTLSKKK